MQTRSLQQIIPSIVTQDGAGVKLFRSIGQQQNLRVDPFLMLDEFCADNPDDYIAGFPSHPHRGFETVTYLLAGQMWHEDHLGHQGLLKSGAAQWMTAGRGIIHSEMPRQDSGQLHGFQLWLNLPGKDKMQPARYADIQPDQIPVVALPDGGLVKVLAGAVQMNGMKCNGPIQSLATEPVLLDVQLPAHSRFTLPMPDTHNAVIYPYAGRLQIGEDNRLKALAKQMAGVLSSGESIQIHTTGQPAAFLLIAGRPLREPIVQYGPFVMNTRAEIEQALSDYHNGQLV